MARTRSSGKKGKEKRTNHIAQAIRKHATKVVTHNIHEAKQKHGQNKKDTTNTGSELLEPLNPDDDLELCQFFQSFAIVAMKRRNFSVVTKEGSKLERKKRMGKTFVRLIAALVVHFR